MQAQRPFSLKMSRSGNKTGPSKAYSQAMKCVPCETLKSWEGVETRLCDFAFQAGNSEKLEWPWSPINFAHREHVKW